MHWTLSKNLNYIVSFISLYRMGTKPKYALMRQLDV